MADLAAAVRQLGALPPLQLGPEDQGGAQAHRPREHLPADRGHLHADRGAGAAAREGPAAARRSSGAARCSASCSASSGSTRRAGSTSRSTSLLGWAAVMYIGDLFAGERRDDDARHRRRTALHGRRGRLRAEAAEPVARALRLPRDLPRLHGAGVPLPLDGVPAHRAAPALARRSASPPDAVSAEAFSVRGVDRPGRRRSVASTAAAACSSASSSS